MGLLDAFKQYISDAMPGGLLSPELPTPSQVGGALAQDIRTGAQNMSAANKAVLANPMDSAAQQKALQYAQALTGMAPVGMTVWHGSPYKFDAFDMSKIGTGEGAQAYGHGLYTAA